MKSTQTIPSPVPGIKAVYSRDMRDLFKTTAHIIEESVKKQVPPSSWHDSVSISRIDIRELYCQVISLKAFVWELNLRAVLENCCPDKFRGGLLPVLGCPVLWTLVKTHLHKSQRGRLL